MAEDGASKEAGSAPESGVPVGGGPQPGGLLRRAWTALGGNAYLLLSFTMLCWGGNTVAGRLAVGEISPMLVTTGRWMVTLVLIYFVVRRHFLADWPVLKRRLPFLLAMGGLGFTGFNALFYIAAHSTSAINLGIIQSAIPVFVLLGAFLVFGTRVTTLQFVGVFVTTVGVVVVAVQGEVARLLGLVFALGDLLMVVACALYAGYTLGLRKRPPVSGLGFFAVMAFAAFLTSLPLVAIEAALGELRWPGWEGIAIVAYVAFFPSFLAQIAFMRGVQLIGPGRSGVFVNLVPVFGALLAVLLLGEPFELFHLGALVLVLGGIALAERGKRGIKGGG